MSSFCPFLVFFQNGWGAVIVCIIYTTGYKTPLCHSPESTYRCGCTEYKHMYCNKIISRAWLLNDRFWDIPRIWRKLSLLWVHTDFLLTHGTYSSFRSQSFERKLPSIPVLALGQLSQPGIRLCRPSLSQSVSTLADFQTSIKAYFSVLHLPSPDLFSFVPQ